jgi:hypothetical protein
MALQVAAMLDAKDHSACAPQAAGSALPDRSVAAGLAWSGRGLPVTAESATRPGDIKGTLRRASAPLTPPSMPREDGSRQASRLRTQEGTMDDLNNPVKALRERQGFALHWWWRGWVALAVKAHRCGAPAQLVEALHRVGAMK